MPSFGPLAAAALSRGRVVFLRRELTWKVGRVSARVANARRPRAGDEEYLCYHVNCEIGRVVIAGTRTIEEDAIVRLEDLDLPCP